jgi:hypothetical protein
MSLRRIRPDEDDFDEDPVSAVANLFDLSIVFIVALMLSLFTVFGMKDVLNEKSSFTMLKKSDSGEVEIISKKGKEIKNLKMSKDEASGKGRRLGTAYMLDDGTAVYVPED